MKYIKKFEKYKEKYKYWKLPTSEPELTVALDMLNEEYGCDIRRYDIYHTLLKGDKPKFEKDNLYILYKEFYSLKTNQFEGFWYWDSPNFLSKIKYKNYKNMGEIEVTEENIKTYNAKKESEKYNL